MINFGQFFGIKNAQKITQEIPKIKKQIKQINFYETQVDQHKKIKGQFCNTNWTNLFAQNPKQIYKRNQDEPKRAIMSFKESNNCL